MATKQRRGAADAETQRLNVRISPDAYRRLNVHAIMAGVNPGTLVETLIDTHLREWRVQANRAAQATPDDRLDLTASVSHAEIAAA
jgi:hypothetical protein